MVFSAFNVTPHIFGFFLKICLTQAALIAIIICVAAVRR